MTIQDKMLVAGREGVIQAGGLQVSVIIREVRRRVEAVDYLVEPTAGAGSAWIDSEEVKIVGDPR